MTRRTCFRFQLCDVLVITNLDLLTNSIRTLQPPRAFCCRTACERKRQTVDEISAENGEQHRDRCCELASTDSSHAGVQLEVAVELLLVVALVAVVARTTLVYTSLSTSDSVLLTPTTSYSSIDSPLSPTTPSLNTRLQQTPISSLHLSR